MVAGLLIGLELAGLPGALWGQVAAHLATYPAVASLARRTGAWDPLHDAAGFALGAAVAALALWVNAGAVAGL